MRPLSNRYVLTAGTGVLVTGVKWRLRCNHSTTMIQSSLTPTTTHTAHCGLIIHIHTHRERERERDRGLPISSRRRWLSESGVVTLRLLLGLQSLLGLDPSPCGNTAWQEEEEPIALTPTCMNTHHTQYRAKWLLQTAFHLQHNSELSTHSWLALLP